MDLLNYKGTETTPSVNFNPDNGKLIIEGNSIPNDAEEFFTPILSWLEEYVNTTKVKTTLIIKLHYFNVSSSKRILYMFYKLNELLKYNKPVVIKWYYSEDEDEMFEVGQDFAFMVNVPFHFIEYTPHPVSIA